MIGRLEAPGAKLEPVMPGFENSRSPSVRAAGAADFLVRHDRDGRELIGDDGQHALLGRGGGRCGLRLWRRFAVLAGRCPRDARRCSRTARPACRRTIGLGAVTVISGSWVEDAARRVLRHRPVGHRAQQ